MRHSPSFLRPSISFLSLVWYMFEDPIVLLTHLSGVPRSMQAQQGEVSVAKRLEISSQVASRSDGPQLKLERRDQG